MRLELKERGCKEQGGLGNSLTCVSEDGDYYEDSKCKDINVNDEPEQEEQDCSEDEGDEDDEEDD